MIFFIISPWFNNLYKMRYYLNFFERTSNLKYLYLQLHRYMVEGSSFKISLFTIPLKLWSFTFTSFLTCNKQHNIIDQLREERFTIKHNLTKINQD